MSTCSLCQNIFDCGMVETSDAPCWCTALPALPADALPSAGDNSLCLCPDCLSMRIAQVAAANA